MPDRTAEGERLEQDRLGLAAWKRWGPYVSERSWGTVREDYSPDGNAWRYFPHDHARSRAYRWGEDGLAGLCDRYQLLVFALAPRFHKRVPVMELGMGVSGKVRNGRPSAGYELVDSPDFVDDSHQGKMSRRTDDLGLEGLGLRAELAF